MEIRRLSARELVETQPITLEEFQAVAGVGGCERLTEEKRREERVASSFRLVANLRECGCSGVDLLRRLKANACSNEGHSPAFAREIRLRMQEISRELGL